jgi:hypothetical protein
MGVMDFNGAPSQRDIGALIPDGTFVKLEAHIRKGKYTIAGFPPADNDLFKEADSGSIMLDWEFVVLYGPHAKQHLWEMSTFIPAKQDSKAADITKGFLRAVLESARGIHPSDESPQAKAGRSTDAISEFEGMRFAARIKVEVGGDNGRGGTFPDKNKIAIVVLPGQPEYEAIMAGQEVAPKPSGIVARAPRGAATGNVSGSEQKPKWQQDAAPAQATPAAQPGLNWASSGGSPTQQPQADGGGTSGPKWLNG